LVFLDAKSASEIFEKRKQELIPSAVEEKVAKIIKQVREEGDQALVDLTQELDSISLKENELRIDPYLIKKAAEEIDPSFNELVKEVEANLNLYHRQELINSFWQPDEKGNILGQIVRPLKRVGIYVPGGTASYPSSVLMNAVPAKVAGVKEIVLVTPPRKNGMPDPYVLATAHLLGIEEIYRVGGAQAIASLAYGTQSIAPVDKITGPGNIYVTAAKKMVYGTVDIDMLAGPSEILIIADETANPSFLAADLLSQLEHDPLANAILISDCSEILKKTEKELQERISFLSRQEVARKAFIENGAFVLAKNINEAIELANEFAPEHLELAVKEPFSILGKIKNAGAVFIGHYSPEPLGDYFAGTNHILPTSGNARFSSPLGVLDFLKRTSVVCYNKVSLAEVSDKIIEFALLEGLDAHAKAIEVRKEEKDE